MSIITLLFLYVNLIQHGTLEQIVCVRNHSNYLQNERMMVPENTPLNVARKAILHCKIDQVRYKVDYDNR